jgi:hypothetical protein
VLSPRSHSLPATLSRRFGRSDANQILGKILMSHHARGASERGRIANSPPRGAKLMASAHNPSSLASTATITSNILNLRSGHAIRTTLNYITASNNLMKTKFTMSTANQSHLSHLVWSMVFRLRHNRIVLCTLSTQRPSIAPQMH